MIKNGTGGSNTTTGLQYESKVSLEDFLNSQKDYSVKETKVYFKEKLVARLFKKNKLYKFLEENGIKWEKHISKKLIPDSCIYVLTNNTAFILEIKHQEVPGSVDEKLQTCDFKKKQYLELFSELAWQVEYYYILNSWFKDSCYKDVLDYIIRVGCKYYFDYIPLQEFGLPIPEDDGIVPSYQL